MDKKKPYGRSYFFLPKAELGFKYFYNHLNTELYSMNLKPWT